jgi:hypothetical protein
MIPGKGNFEMVAVYNYLTLNACELRWFTHTTRNLTKRLSSNEEFILLGFTGPNPNSPDGNYRGVPAQVKRGCDIS